MKVEYEENTNSLILSFDGVAITLPANHQTLSLWRFLGIPKYQRWLWERQGRKCADCGKDLPAPRRSKVASLHHDPKLGAEGSKAVDYKGTTRNRVLCHECHKKADERARGCLGGVK